ncbi:MAG: hypothetical protein PWP06_1708, partial [Candidatus Marinimicrobia bacterium]|nr:hypothetical protein [Candidatus Neomarinimicrobiota bacterium]
PAGPPPTTMTSQLRLIIGFLLQGFHRTHLNAKITLNAYVIINIQCRVRHGYTIDGTHTDAGPAQITQIMINMYHGMYSSCVGFTRNEN